MADASFEEAAARVRQIFGKEVSVKKAHAETTPEGDDYVVDLITRVCYFYPQYTLETAQQLPHVQVVALIRQAEKQRAIDYYNLTVIAAAPHSKGGKLVNKLLKQFKKIIDS